MCISDRSLPSPLPLPFLPLPLAKASTSTGCCPSPYGGGGGGTRAAEGLTKLRLDWTKARIAALASERFRITE
eukprot:5677958-Alexandrium_andersonii.AAC.1